MGDTAHTPASSHPNLVAGSFWEDFQAGVGLAERMLPELSDDLLLLSRIVAELEANNLGRPGMLAGFLARVAEAARHDPTVRAAQRRRSAGHAGRGRKAALSVAVPKRATTVQQR